MAIRLFTHDDLPAGAEFHGGFATMTDFGKYLVEELREYSDDVEGDFLQDFMRGDQIDYEAYAHACLCENNGSFMLVADKDGFLAYDVG
jgi:hypothetical protein